MNFDELLKSLHQEYLTSLPAKIAAIGKQADAGAAGELRESFHKLKGTGRTYGMPEVSELAAVVEEVCADFPANAAAAARLALGLLTDIHAARGKGAHFDLEADPRLKGIRKLLQNESPPR